MITAEQIPDEVAEAANSTLWEMPYMRERHKEETRAAIAAALNAWLGMTIDIASDDSEAILLPLPQKDPRT